jgi:hypothetical protein
MAEWAAVWLRRGEVLDELHIRKRLVYVCSFHFVTRAHHGPPLLLSLRDAEDAREVEIAAAITVQRHYRGSVVREDILLRR